MERFNDGGHVWRSEVGFEAGSPVAIRRSTHRCYREIRERFGLSAQMAVRAIGKAVEALASLHAKGETGCLPRVQAARRDHVR
jgi:hypothetical protein